MANSPTSVAPHVLVITSTLNPLLSLVRTRGKFPDTVHIYRPRLVAPFYNGYVSLVLGTVARCRSRCTCGGWSVRIFLQWNWLPYTTS